MCVKEIRRDNGSARLMCSMCNVQITTNIWSDKQTVFVAAALHLLRTRLAHSVFVQFVGRWMHIAQVTRRIYTLKSILSSVSIRNTLEHQKQIIRWPSTLHVNELIR